MAGKSYSEDYGCGLLILGFLLLMVLEGLVSKWLDRAYPVPQPVEARKDGK